MLAMVVDENVGYGSVGISPDIHGVQERRECTLRGPAVAVTATEHF